MFIETYLKDAAPWLLTVYYKQALWVWMALPILFVSAFVLSAVITRSAAFVLNLAIRKRKVFYNRYIAPLQAPVELWLGIVIFAASTHLLPLSKATQGSLKYLIGSVAIYAIIWAMFRLVTNTSDSMRERFLSKGKISAASLIPLMRKLLKAFLAGVALLFLLQNWGFDVAAILAGLGIGGIAIALASQKSVENLFGGVSVTLDQPVRIGDAISFGDKTGTVEDIGLRSTTIRTPSRSLITVPNSQFSEMQLENFTAREKLLIQKTIGLRYDTTPKQLRTILSRITDYLVQHPEAEDVRARLINLGASSLDIEIFAFIMTLDGLKFLKIQEDVFLNVIQIVNDAGAEFASPAPIIYMENTQQKVA